MFFQEPFGTFMSIFISGFRAHPIGYSCFHLFCKSLMICVILSSKEKTIQLHNKYETTPPKHKKRKIIVKSSSSKNDVLHFCFEVFG